MNYTMIITVAIISIPVSIFIGGVLNFLSTKLQVEQIDKFIEANKTEILNQAVKTITESMEVKCVSLTEFLQNTVNEDDEKSSEGG